MLQLFYFASIFPFSTLPSCFSYQSNLNDCVMAGGLEAEVPGHAPVSGVVWQVKTERVQVTKSDETISCSTTPCIRVLVAQG